MAQVLVTNEDATLLIPITTDQVDGRVVARCPIHGEIEDGYNFEDVVEAATLHVEYHHEEK